MREIKFRALKDDMSNCVFYYGSLIYNKNGDPRIHDIDTDLFHTCLKKTEGQFTGLLDKNKKEIYEGDILSVGGEWVGDYRYPGFNGVVEFDDGEFAVIQTNIGHELDSCSIHNLNMEVIGNIHQNPELL